MLKFMSDRVKKLTAVSLGAAVLLCGCGGNKKGVSGDGKDYLNAEYPIKTDVTLTYWCDSNASANSYGTNLGETPLFKKVMEETGIKIEFKHPPQGQKSEQFNLMVASGEMPDLMQYNFLSFSGGPEKAIKENLIISLNDLIDEGYTPNFKSVIESDDTLRKSASTDSGKFYAFPFIRSDEQLMTYNGPMIRKDWLDELGLEIPETIDEWENVLTEFKNKKGAEAPLMVANMLPTFITTSAFVGAFGVKDGFYVENGKVHYGPMEDGYKEYLKLLRKWFEMGLIDKNFATSDKSSTDNKIMLGKAGATVGLTGSSMGTYLTAMESKDPKFNMTATPYPVLNKGDKPKFCQYTGVVPHGYDVAISSASKHKELAARLMDYGYSEKGHMLFNFGIEGESYNMVDGYPKYTDLITKNPKGLNMNQAMGGYMQSQYGGSFVQDVRYLEQYYSFEQQKDAIKIWSNTDEAKYHMPDITPTEDEAGEYASIMNAVDTYKAEMAANFILGQESFDNYDKFVNQLKSLNIERAIEINQKGYERYGKR